MIQKVNEYIAKHQLLSTTDKVIVGVSGGADSIALLDILSNLGYDCIVAHCNFHLRGEESNEDATFVEFFCKEHNKTYLRIDFDTENYASENKISIEMAARDLRYNWFENLRQKHNAQAIAIAHHMDDSVETVILNLTRGTGIRGLTGINVKNGYIIRPLLCLSRNDILQYLGENGLSYVTDSTNNEDIYTRNKIRLNIIPLLEAINPSAKKAILRTSSHLQQVENIYQAYIESARKEIVNNNCININRLLEYNEPDAVLYEILAEYGFNPSTVKNIFEALENQSGKSFYSDDYRLVKDRDFLIIHTCESPSANDVYTIAEKDIIITDPIRLTVECIAINEDFKIDKNPNRLYLDMDSVKFPLTIRRWQNGDWFIPFGMKGKKKISDYFSDNKFSLFDKENTWILCSGSDIVWIIGHRSDNRFRISESTKEVLMITAKL